jgi:hypothetical protein
MHPAAARAKFDHDVAQLSPALAQRRLWVFHTLAFPLIDCSFTGEARTQLRLRLHCDDWNDLPPEVSLHAADGTPLTVLSPNPTNVFHNGPHPTTNRPFICMAGTREYHTHPSHLNDLWEARKGHSNFDLGGILTQIWNAWLKGQN